MSEKNQAALVPETEENFRKILDTESLAGSPYILFDDCNGFFRSAILNAFLTAPTWSGRPPSAAPIPPSSPRPPTAAAITPSLTLSSLLLLKSSRPTADAKKNHE